MSTIAQIEFPADEFALGATLSASPDVELDVERIVAHGSEHVLPLVWAIGDDLDSLETLFETDQSVESFELVSEFDGRRLYRMDWVVNIRLIVHILVEENATILNAHAKDGQWVLRILFPEHAALSQTFEYCEQNDISFDVRVVHELTDGEHDRFGLTDAQHEALTIAVKRGYYAIPRITGIHDLAAELDISHQALSERLRRGQETLLRNTLLVERETEHEE